MATKRYIHYNIYQQKIIYSNNSRPFVVLQRVNSINAYFSYKFHYSRPYHSIYFQSGHLLLGCVHTTHLLATFYEQKVDNTLVATVRLFSLQPDTILFCSTFISFRSQPFRVFDRRLLNEYISVLIETFTARETRRIDRSPVSSYVGKMSFVNNYTCEYHRHIKFSNILHNRSVDAVVERNSQIDVKCG
jgi:hypothetical protein